MGDPRLVEWGAGNLNTPQRVRRWVEAQVQRLRRACTQNSVYQNGIMDKRGCQTVLSCCCCCAALPTRLDVDRVESQNRAVTGIQERK